jgi:hypothetical protein
LAAVPARAQAHGVPVEDEEPVDELLVPHAASAAARRIPEARAAGLVGTGSMVEGGR